MRKKSEREALEVIPFADKLVTVQRRPYRRAIGITLQVNGSIRVTAPKSAPLKKIQAFIEANAAWIQTHSQRYEDLRRAYPPKQYREGEIFLLLGERLPLHFIPADRRGFRFRRERGLLICEVPREQWLTFNPYDEHPELGEVLVKFFEKAGREIIGARISFFAERMGLYPRGVTFRSQKTRWGSCSSQGKLSLNWRLVIAPREVIDYVVVHELSHLRYYNHSHSFWNLVGTQIPNYSDLRDWLRVNQYEADFLAKRSELHD